MRTTLVACATAIALLATPATASATFRPKLVTRLQAALNASPAGGGGTGVLVTAVKETASVYGRNAARTYMPASTMKLVTSAAALDRLGPYFRWKTTVSLESTPTTAGVVKGDIYLVGGGDPMLATRARKRRLGIAGASYLDDLAQALGNKGVKRIIGAIVADESFFDSKRIGNKWKASYRDECAPLSALSLDRNVASGGGWVSSPPLGAARRFRDMLSARGIHVSGAIRTGREPKHHIEAGVEWSAPLYRLLTAMNRTSDNFCGEMLAKTNGRVERGAGTTYSGARVAASELASAGVAPSRFRTIDGSGLSRYNRLAPEAVTKLLQYAAKKKWGRYLDASLPVAGRSGTLSDRMRGTAAAGVTHAKTGTLRDVSALAGYVTCRGGTRFAFDVVTNGAAVANARALQDRIAVILASYPGR